MGFRPCNHGDYAFMVAVCKWCADAPAAEARAAKGGFPVTHGICEECAQNNFAKIIPESEPR
jgi:hypothetical protein